MCIIPFIKRAERGRHTPHNYESTPVDPLRHVGIVSSTEAPRYKIEEAPAGCAYGDQVGRQ